MLRVADIRIDPRVTSKADGFRKGKEQAGIPMDDDKDIKH